MFSSGTLKALFKSGAREEDNKAPEVSVQDEPNTQRSRPSTSKRLRVWNLR